MIIHSTNASWDPNVSIGPTWERITGKFLLGATDDGASSWDLNTKSASIAAGVSGGEAAHTLLSSESGVPAHNHKLGTSGLFYVGGNAPEWPGSGGNVQNYKGTTNATTWTIANNTAANASTSHNIMPPFLAVYIWKKTA